MNKNILITSAGRRVSLVKAFQKELKLLFPEAIVITTDSNPDFSAACQVSDKAKEICKVNDPNYINNLIEICKSNNIGMIVPTIDTELQILSKNSDKLKEFNLICSSLEFIDMCRDKRKINHFFSKNCINIPKEINKYEPNFPLFIKPFNGSLSAEIHVINKQEELTEYFLNDPKFMFMEYLSPQENDEFTIDMYYDKNNNLKCLVPRKRIEIRGGEISKGITIKNKIFDFIFNKLSFIEGAVGCLTLQVFVNKKNNLITGIEINPRFGGGYPLSYLAGANFPKWLIQEYLLKEDLIDFYNDWKENLIMLRYDAEVLVQK